ncbi:MAG: hypothetical protein O2779_00615 [Nanoarchaeota archaeon]|nr:hypothetical protein [Nanoarchaeota archaeon]
MSIITIILFFIYTYCLGYTLAKNNDAPTIEKHTMRIGIGLAVLPFLLVLLHTLHLPVDWKIVLVIIIIKPLIDIIKHPKLTSKPKITKSDLYGASAIGIALVVLVVFLNGAFNYPYFEDDDPWVHAVGVKYVSIEKKLDDPNNKLKYIDPYPPGYDAVIGTLHQTSPDIMWTMKFFNSLIIAIGIACFFFFAKTFMQSSQKALLATATLAMLPSYLSHFIWAHALVITLFIISLYPVLKVEEDKRWILPAVLAITGMVLTQPSQPIKYAVMFGIFLLVKSIVQKKIPVRQGLTIAGGYLLSLIWWIKNGVSFGSRVYNDQPELYINAPTGLAKVWATIQDFFPPQGGTATRAYSFNDFFVVKSQNLINNPVGLGVAISIITLLSIAILLLAFKGMKKQKKIWTITTLFWLLFAFLGVNSLTFNLPVGLFAFRFWMILAIPVSLLTAEGIVSLSQLAKQVNIPKIATISLLLLLIFFTAGKQKIEVNTANWPPGQMWTSNEEVAGYVWMKDLPANTKVFAYSNDEQVIGVGTFSCRWCDDVIEFREGLLNRTSQEVYTWSKKNNYEYILFDGKAFRDHQSKYGNKTTQLLNQHIQEFSQLPQATVAFQNPGIIIFKI